MHSSVLCGNPMIFKLLLSYFEDTKARSTAHSCEIWACEVERKTEVWTQGPKLATLCYILIILIFRKLHTASNAKSFTLSPLGEKKFWNSLLNESPNY